MKYELKSSNKDLYKFNDVCCTSNARHDGFNFVYFLLRSFVNIAVNLTVKCVFCKRFISSFPRGIDQDLNFIGVFFGGNPKNLIGLKHDCARVSLKGETKQITRDEGFDCSLLEFTKTIGLRARVSISHI